MLYALWIWWGIRNLGDIEEIFNIGVEKVIINSYAVENTSFVESVSRSVGSKSVVVSMDVTKTLLGKYEVVTNSGKKKTKLEPVNHAILMQEMGAGKFDDFTEVKRKGGASAVASGSSLSFRESTGRY